MSEQLTLPVSLHEDLTFANFYPGENEFLLANLTAMAEGKGERYLFLWGHAGTGRSHLLQACCHHAFGQDLRASYLSFKQFNLTPEILENLESFDLICLDDIQAIAGNTVWEEALFHFYNRSLQRPTRLIIAGNSVPNELKIQLPDLVSRLSSNLILAIQSLSDEEKIAALCLRAKNRGFKLSLETAQFILHHVSRDLSNLFAVLEQLDQVSLAAQRKLTIPFVKNVLSL